MKRILLIATLIFVSCAVAPAQDVRAGSVVGASQSSSINNRDR